MSELADNLARLRERIDSAARRGGRSGDDVTLIAVTKGRGPSVVRALWDLGLRDFGENRVQEALGKVDDAPADVRWHLIGHLQANKINKVLPWVSMIQSVDSIQLAEALSQRASRLGLTLPVLLEVKTSDETTKHGVSPEAAVDAYARIGELPAIEPRGLMTIAPLGDESVVARASFVALRRIFEQLQTTEPRPRILSMGMSGDLEIAIEEGSTMVRVGRALSGPS